MHEENRAFMAMHRVARSWLAGSDPGEIARLSGVAYDPERSEFALSSLGREMRMRWPECAVRGDCGPWHELLLLHYMHLADGTLPSGAWISFSELRDGMLRGGGFDRDSAARLSGMLGGLAPAAVERA